MRKIFTINCLFGAPISSKLGGLFISHPLQIGELPRVKKRDLRFKENARKRHPIHEVLNWQNEMGNLPDLTASEIAVTKGISKARVSQMMAMLKLNKDIQEFLCALDDPRQIHFFSERRLRMLKGKSGEAQTEIMNRLRSLWEQRCSR